MEEEELTLETSIVQYEEVADEKAVSSERLRDWEQHVESAARQVEEKRMQAEEARLQELNRMRTDDSGIYGDAEQSIPPSRARMQFSGDGANETTTKAPVATKGTPKRTDRAQGQVPDTHGVVLKYTDIKGRKKHYMYSEEVDGTHLEAYLSDAEFEEVFGIDKGSFYGKPKWRQIEMLKKVALF